jgi:hypothetical protein
VTQSFLWFSKEKEEIMEKDVRDMASGTALNRCSTIKISKNSMHVTKSIKQWLIGDFAVVPFKRFL